MPFEFAWTSDWLLRMRARDFINLNSRILFAVRSRSLSNKPTKSDSVDDIEVLASLNSLDWSAFLIFFVGGAIVFNSRLNFEITNNKTDFATFFCCSCSRNLIMFVWILNRKNAFDRKIASLECFVTFLHTRWNYVVVFLFQKSNTVILNGRELITRSNKTSCPEARL